MFFFLTNELKGIGEKLWITLKPVTYRERKKERKNRNVIGTEANLLIFTMHGIDTGREIGRETQKKTDQRSIDKGHERMPWLKWWYKEKLESSNNSNSEQYVNRMATSKRWRQ